MDNNSEYFSNRVIVYHVPVFNSGQILIDIRRIPFNDYEHVIINLVRDETENAPDTEPMNPVVRDFRRLIERRERRIRRRLAANANLTPNGRLYIARNIQDLNAQTPIDIFYRPPNEANISAGQAAAQEQGQMEDGQEAAANDQQPPASNLAPPVGVFFQHYMINAGQAAAGMIFRPRQFPAYGGQLPMEHSGIAAVQFPLNEGQNRVGHGITAQRILTGGVFFRPRVAAPNIPRAHGYAASGSSNRNATFNGFGGHAVPGRVVIQKMSQNVGHGSQTQHVSLGNAEANGGLNTESAARNPDVSSTSGGIPSGEGSSYNNGDVAGRSTYFGVGENTK